MPRPRNYKQNKKRREDAQKKRNEEQQLRKAARKATQAELGPSDRADGMAVLPLPDASPEEAK